MGIVGDGWELLISRSSVQYGSGEARTVGTYQVYHDGDPVAGLTGMTAEADGPSSNSTKGVRILPGRYPLWTQNGTDYDTIDYSPSQELTAKPKPGIELKGTEPRTEILVHPGKDDFLSSVGCINLCESLPDAHERIDYLGSRHRVIMLIDDARSYAGASFPTQNGHRMPRCWAVIAGDP